MAFLGLTDHFVFLIPFAFLIFIIFESPTVNVIFFGLIEGFLTFAAKSDFISKGMTIFIIIITTITLASNFFVLFIIILLCQFKYSNVIVQLPASAY
jgi:hypothetical protein